MNWDDDDDDFNFENLSPEENEELDRQMREEEKRRVNHPMTKQAEEIYRVVTALVESIKDETEREMFGSTLLESCMIIPAKLAGAIGSESWLLSMQNAAIIRSHAEYILTATSGMKHQIEIDQVYVQLLRDEMLKFRDYFVEWAKEINQMEDEEYVDEWGLFLRKE
ncbi:hypothetical protein BH09BAC5_BH09BAC5_22770 [soil metagenome]